MEALQKRLEVLELENASLRQKLESKNPLELGLEPLADLPSDQCEPAKSEKSLPHTINGLTLEEYQRYGRQMIVPEFGGLQAQLQLKNSSVLVIGAGGLGCPALLYLAAAGIGRIGIVDADTVDVSNLHRQVLHTSANLGLPKVESACRFLRQQNPNVTIETYQTLITTENAITLTSKYLLVLDCTDNPATRYLVNDACVINGITLVSGSGLRTIGQLSVLNYNNKGPCYRCFYPVPPPANSVTLCQDGGVVGPAIGLMGITMALEAIKCITGAYEEGGASGSFSPFLSMYAGYPQQNLRVFKMRQRQAKCAVCGANPSITSETLPQVDYVAFCGKLNPNVLSQENRISPKEYKSLLESESRPFLLDVRPKEQFDIVSLLLSVNMPWPAVLSKAVESQTIELLLPDSFDKTKDTIYVVCRYGNDSQLAAEKLIGWGFIAKDICGGLNKWSQVVDSNVPIY